jgi:hypothetical protein
MLAAPKVSSLFITSLHLFTVGCTNPMGIGSDVKNSELVLENETPFLILCAHS